MALCQLYKGIASCHIDKIQRSGHLQYRSLQVTPGTVLAARVGDQREASSLASTSGDTVTAQPGQDSRYTYGGRHGGDA